jgi:hypothetical protein
MTRSSKTLWSNLSSETIRSEEATFRPGDHSGRILKGDTRRHEAVGPTLDEASSIAPWYAEISARAVTTAMAKTMAPPQQSVAVSPRQIISDSAQVSK